MVSKRDDVIQRYVNQLDMNSDFLFSESTFQSLVDEIATYVEMTCGADEKQNFLKLIVENDPERKILSGRIKAYLFSMEERQQSKSSLHHKEPSTGGEKSDRLIVSQKSVFIVHGHDNEAKETVARFITNLGLKPIILHEQPSGSKTTIDKLESNAEEISFAIVLLTPDDKGAPIGSDDYRNRARQNVIYELGFFNAKLGRNRVCTLKKGEIEVLSDYLGVVYVEMEDGGAWKNQLAREIKAAGLPINLEALLS
jgi:hypothetical protein